MRPYELVMILDSGAEDATVQTVIDHTKSVVTQRSGTIGQVEKWGRRRFAFEMKHRWEGYYILTELSATPEAVAELDRTLNLNDDVLRHKIIRVPDAVAGRSKPAPHTAPAQAGATEINGATDD